MYVLGSGGSNRIRSAITQVLLNLIIKKILQLLYTMPKYKKETIKLGDEKIVIKKGALRSQLKVPEGKDISMTFLNKIIKANVGDSLINPYTKKE